MTTAPDERTFGGARRLRGRVRVPGDKSISHRALLFAAIANGRCTLTHLATGDDVSATQAAVAALGVKVRSSATETTVFGGGIDHLTEPAAELDCGNSGTTMRIISGLLAGRPFLSVLTGDASLRERPMARVVEPLRAMGATVDGRDDGTRAPLVIRGGALHGRSHELAVASAQVKSALILAGLQARGTSEITSPASTRDHTERMLRALGAPVEVDGLTVRVRPGECDAFDLEIPGDPSSAAFFVVAAAITPGSEIVVEDVAVNPTRLGYVDVLRRMGADIEVAARGERGGEPVGDIVVRAARLTGTTIAGDEIPNVQDEVPALAIAAAFADGVTEIRDAAELTVKESNRIGTVHQELTQLGIAVETRTDGLWIRGGSPRAAQLKSHGDHRIAMAAAIAANAIDGASTVRGWSAVRSSYPEFADDLTALTSA
jgi:3-phosphoshikimate 1-carboxyvinyltransferase